MRSNVTRVAMPSANVATRSATTRLPLRHERAKASAPSAWMPMTSTWRPATVVPARIRTRRCRRRSARARHRRRTALEDLQRVGRDAGDEMRLVGGVHVAQAVGALTSSSTCSRASSKSRPCSMTSAPSARMAAFLSGLLPVGTTIVHGTPSRRHASAIDWPWLPVVAVITPRRSSGVRSATRFRPPRTLNAPVGLWFSCLTKIVEPGPGVEQRMARAAASRATSGRRWRARTGRRRDRSTLSYCSRRSVPPEVHLGNGASDRTRTERAGAPSTSLRGCPENTAGALTRRGSRGSRGSHGQGPVAPTARVGRGHAGIRTPCGDVWRADSGVSPPHPPGFARRPGPQTTS